MPWRGPQVPGEFPTLGGVVADWIEAHCVIPDRVVAGKPFKLSDHQYTHLLWQFRLHPNAEYDEDRPAAPFAYVGSLLVRSQKWGKGPFSAARICAQAAGPVLFGGWDANGEPVGMPWATPHIQVAAVAEDQTDNIWRALKPMIELGPLADVIVDTGLDRMNLAGGGKIEPVSSNALTRLGARINYVEIDQPESMNRRNGGERLVDTLLRNLAGMGGRWSATGNAYDPTEQSVEQTWIEKPLDDVHIDYPEPLAGSWGNRRERRRILKHAYKGSPWVDVDRIESDCDRLAAKGDPGQAERFFGNRIVAAADAAFDIEHWRNELMKPGGIDPGRLVTLGFDGSRRRDATGIVATDIETGHQIVVEVWARPLELHDDDFWEVPEAEVDEAMADAMSRWNVIRAYCDPPRWESTVDKWAGKYEAVAAWETYRTTPMAFALRGFTNAIRDREVSHDGHEVLAEHIGNARREKLPGRYVDQDGDPLYKLRKDSPDSTRKIDLAMCAVLSWEARGDAIAAGALSDPGPKRYGVYQW